MDFQTRKKNRLDNFDYSQNGVYFITICVKDRKPILSKISTPTVVAGMKRYVSKQLGKSIWQKGFYDHIIRDEYDYQIKYQYIDENPEKWIDDELYWE